MSTVSSWVANVVSVQDENRRVFSQCGPYPNSTAQKGGVTMSYIPEGVPPVEDTLYARWLSIKRRTYILDRNSNFKSPNITMCEEWRTDYHAFAKWANENGYNIFKRLRRIDRHSGFCPENCEWHYPETKNGLPRKGL